MDWAKNVLAAGHFTMDVEGVSYAATHPQIVDFEDAAADVRRGLQLRYRFYSVEHFLRLHAQVAAGPGGQATADEPYTIMAAAG